jgi:hypothetical protein
MQAKSENVLISDAVSEAETNFSSEGWRRNSSHIPQRPTPYGLYRAMVYYRWRWFYGRDTTVWMSCFVSCRNISKTTKPVRSCIVPGSGIVLVRIRMRPREEVGPSILSVPFESPVSKAQCLIVPCLVIGLPRSCRLKFLRSKFTPKDGWSRRGHLRAQQGTLMTRNRIPTALHFEKIKPPSSKDPGRVERQGSCDYFVKAQWNEFLPESTLWVTASRA